MRLQIGPIRVVTGRDETAELVEHTNALTRRIRLLRTAWETERVAHVHLLDCDDPDSCVSYSRLQRRSVSLGAKVMR